MDQSSKPNGAAKYRYEPIHISPTFLYLFPGITDGKQSSSPSEAMPYTAAFSNNEGALQPQSSELDRGDTP